MQVFRAKHLWASRNEYKPNPVAIAVVISRELINLTGELVMAIIVLNSSYILEVMNLPI